MEKLRESIENYLKYSCNIENNLKIEIIDGCCENEDDIERKISTLDNSISGLIFITHEKHLRNKNCKKTEGIRGFYEENFASVSFNQYNWRTKFIELACKMKTNKNTFAKVKNEWEKIKNKITRLEGDIQYNMNHGNDIFVDFKRYNPLAITNLKILWIDDKPYNINNYLIHLRNLLGENVEIDLIDEYEWKKFLRPEFWEKLCEGNTEETKIKFYQKDGLESLITRNKEDIWFRYHYIIVDLIYDSFNEGNYIIRQFIRLRTILNRKAKTYSPKSIFDIIVVSESKKMIDIERALRERAIAYIFKSENIIKTMIEISSTIATLEKTRNKIAEAQTFLTKSRNFGKLYQLPERIKRKLQTESFYDANYGRHCKKHAYEWIKSLPKAELHCHFGGAMSEELVFVLSLNYLRKTNKTEKIINDIVNLLKEDKFKELINNLTNTNQVTKSHLKKELKSAGKNFKNFDYFLCLFIVVIGIKQGLGESTIKKVLKLWIDIEKESNRISNKEKMQIFLSNIEKNKIGNIFENLEKKLNEFLGSIREKIKINSNDIHLKIKDLITVRENDNSNSEYNRLQILLKGTLFTGNLQLQFYENIAIAVGNIIARFVEDNVRYLELRVSPDGYTKLGMSVQEAIDALLKSADIVMEYFYRKNKPIIVNYIFAGKKKRSPDRIAIEVASVVMNRTGVKLHNTNKAFQEKLYPMIQSKINAFDLSGEEKGTKLEEYIKELWPLFRTCSFITIHAGEEEGAEYIWEAIYLLHANRIGHGLTISQNKFLKEIVRDMRICIELCPTSNLFTNPEMKEEYPLWDFIMDGITCTINTDDPGLIKRTDGLPFDLSAEYVKAAELYWKRARSKILKDKFLIKWETLRIVKNGFKKAFIERKEKRELLKAVEEELYQLILKFERMEPNYEIN